MCRTFMASVCACVCAADIPTIVRALCEVREAADAVAPMRASSGSTKDKWASRLASDLDSQPGGSAVCAASFCRLTRRSQHSSHTLTPQTAHYRSVSYSGAICV